MITSAAVRIYDKKQGKEFIMPVHRHCDAFYILKQLGYKSTDFNSKQADQGFVDENDKFYNRVEAHRHAWNHNQLKDEKEYHPRELFSEDLY